LTVTFTNLSSGDFDTCAWEYGDGDNSSDCDDHDHEYISPGVYSVTLAVSGLGGIDALTRTNYITVYQHVVADFSADPISGRDPLTVTFSNLSTGDYDTCAWDFGDGGNSSECNDPTYTYAATGVYTVTLTVTGLGGSETETKVGYITVGSHQVFLPVLMKGP
jgi:PKD repeat protein